MDSANTKKTAKVDFFSISLGRLVILSILTLSLYQVYWFYRNWKALQPTMPQVKHPVWRAIFAIFYCYSLFKIIINSAKTDGFKENYRPGLLALVYILLFLVSIPFTGSGVDSDKVFSSSDVQYYLLDMLSIVPILLVQKALLFSSGHRRVTDFRSGEKILIGLGMLSFALTVLGIIFGL
jgi:hypothetical protein